MKRLLILSSFLLLLGLLATTQTSQPQLVVAQPEAAPVALPSPVATQAGVEEALQSAPVMFVENVGQFDDDARFHVRGGDVDLWLADDALWITLLEAADEAAPPQSPPILPHASGRWGKPEADLREPFDPEADLRENNELDEPRKGVNLKLSFVGANPQPEIEPFDLLETKMNYFLGNDSDKWRSNVPVWGGVRYKEIYPGVDLELTSENGRSVQRFVVHSRADPSSLGTSFDAAQVQLRVEGADQLELLPSPSIGSSPLELGGIEGGRGEVMGLTVKTAIGDVTLPFFALVTPDGTPLDSPRAPTLNNNHIQAPFSPTSQETRALVPDSTLSYSTFIGGSDRDYGYSLALDSAGNAVVTGWTLSSNFPTTAGSYDMTHNGGSTDTFVLKLSSAGDALIYSTFIGGSSGDAGYSLALDSAGNAVVTGMTLSSDFPTTAGSYDTTDNRQHDAFVLQLSSAGDALTYSTFIGGSDQDYGYSLALDSAGNAVVTGYTQSSNFPTTAGSYDTTHNGGYTDTFVLKLNAAGDALLYSTFIGGSSSDRGYSLALDSAGHAVVTGYTYSDDFPTTAGSYDTTYNGDWDAFVLQLSSAGDALAYSTLLGGVSNDQGRSLALDSAGNPVVTGLTQSSNFPTTAGSYDTTHNGSSDTFVLKLSSAGDALFYSTFIGGSDYDYGSSLGLDSAGHAVVTGGTSSSDFPTTAGSYDTTHNRFSDAFVLKLSSAGDALTYSTFIGGSSSEGGSELKLDRAGHPVVMGLITSEDFPTTAGSYDTTYNGDYDVFVLRFDGLEPPPTPTPTPSNTPTPTRTPTPSNTPTPTRTPTPTNTPIPPSLQVSVWEWYEVAGNGNGLIDGGERIGLEIGLFNESGGSATGVSGMLTAGGNVTLESSESVYADIAVGGTQVNSTAYTFTVDPTIACTGDLSFSLLVTHHGSQQSTFPVSIPTGMGAVRSESYDGEAVAIPDDNPTGASASLEVPTSGMVADVDVRLDIDHAYDSDLDIFLVSPSGTRVELSTDNGGDGGHYQGTIFDDDAATPIISGTAPFTGRFQPEGRLAELNGEAVHGTWRLEVADDTFGDTGTLTGFALDIQTISYVCLAVTANSPTILGDTTTFNPTIDSPYERLEWDFGDSSPLIESQAVPITHTYAAVGDYSATVRAFLFGELASTVEIPVSIVIGPPASMVLSASPESLQADLSQHSTLSATVRDANGNLVPNQTVTFNTTLGQLSLERPVTNGNGVASTILSNPELYLGTANISTQAKSVAANGQVAFSAVACNDIEENDRLAEASDLTSLNAACSGSLADDPQEESDYYTFDLSEGLQIKASLRDMASDTNYNLQLIAQDLQVVEQSANAGNANEALLSPPQAAGNYYVRVHQKTKGQKSNQYTLAVSAVSPTPSATPTATATALPTNTPTPSPTPPPPDGKSCQAAFAIATEGSQELQSFDQQADSNWLKFPVQAGTEYIIEARVPPASPADVALELFDECSGSPQSENPDFSPDVRITLNAPADGTYYLHLLNNSPSVYGPDVTYYLSVRAVSRESKPGALILVAGRYEEEDQLQANIHHVTNNVYQLFRDNGYPAERIHYLATDSTLDADGDQVADVEHLASNSNLQSAITEWAVDKVGPDRALTLYLMDHGGHDILYLDAPRDEWVQPDELNQWLQQLEDAVPGLKINIIVEACNSGSFIDLAKSISKPGRVVITSTAAYALAYASDKGAIFSDAFLSGLAQGMSLYGAFREAEWATQESHSAQTPWIDDDGDGLPNRPTDGAEAAQRGFTFAGTFPENVWSPYIVQVELQQTEGNRLEVLAEVRDDVEVDQVWAVIYPPSYLPPKSSEELVAEPLPITLQPRGNDTYGAAYGELTEKGTYRIVVYAEDNNALLGRPKETTLSTGSQLFLPMLSR